MSKLKLSSIIMKKELKAYFMSPIAYIVITIFLIFTGFFFFKDFFYFNQAQMRNLFQLLPLMFTFVIPAITMRLFSEEKQSGSLEILVTMPVTSFDIVMGKFFSALIFVSLMFAPTLIYLITIIFVGSPDYGPIIGGYLGALFLAGAYVSIGILMSVLSRNQILAFISAWAISFFFWLIDKVTVFIPGAAGFLGSIGSDFHFQNIARGIIDTRDIIYFLSIIVISLMFTAKILEERR